MFLFEKGNTGRNERDRCSFRSVYVYIRKEEHHHYRYRNDQMNYFLFSAIDCRNCGNLIWAGHSSTGIPTKLDPTRLNLLAEITAKLAGLRTYQIHRLGRTFEATPRVAARMWAKSAIVLAEHQCRPISIFGEVAPDYFGNGGLPPKSATSTDGIPF